MDKSKIRIVISSLEASLENPNCSSERYVIEDLLTHFYDLIDKIDRESGHYVGSETDSNSMEYNK